MDKSKKSQQVSAGFEPLESRILLSADLTGAFDPFAVTSTMQPGTRNAVVVQVENEGDPTSVPTVAVDFYGIADGEEFDLDTATLLQRVNTPLRTGIAKATISIPTSLEAGNYRLVAVIDSQNKVAEDNKENNIIVSDVFTVIQPDYDIVPSLNGTPTLPTQIVEGQTARGVVKVLLANPAESTKSIPTGQKVAVSVYLRPDGAPDDGSEDVDITARPTLVSVSNLVPGRSANANVNVTVPSGLDTDTYTLIVKADSTGLLAEVDETNNEITGPTVTVAEAFVDMAVTEVTHTFPASVLGGASARATATVQNNGNVDAKGTVTVTFYASDHDELDEDADEIGSISRSATLRAGATLKLTGSVNAPIVEEGGTGYILARVEFTPATESVPNDSGNESDNVGVAERMVTVAPAFVDMAVTEVTHTFPASVLGGASARATATVQNNGNVDAKGTVTVTFYMSNDGGGDAIIAPEPTMIGSITKSANLRAGATLKLTSSVTAPNVDESETNDIFAVVEFTPASDSVPSDSGNESDNEGFAENSVTVAPAFVDMAVTEVTHTFPASVLGGASARATATVQNNGNVDAKGTVTVTFYASDHDELDEDADEIGSITKSTTLRAGATLKLTGSVNAPIVEEGGTGYILARVEFTPSSDSVPNDSGNESDNVGVAERMVTVAPAFVDMAVTEVTHTFPASVLGGASAKATATVQNNGNVDAKGTVTVTFYASESDELDEDAEAIGSISRSATLRAGATLKLTGSVNAPNVEEGGTGYILARVEFTPSSDSVPNDSGNESDNVGVAEDMVTIAPAFVDIAETATTSTFGASAVAKTNGSMTTTVKNNGNVDAKGTVTVYFFASPSGELDGEAVLIGSVSKVVTLKAGASTSLTGSVQLPNPLSATPYTLFSSVEFEPSNGVSENNYDNNDGSGGVVNITPVPPTLSDLLGTMSFVETNPSSGTGGSGTFTTTTGYSGTYAWAIFTTPIPSPVNKTATLAFLFDLPLPPGFVGSQNSLVMTFNSASLRPDHIGGRTLEFTETRTGSSKGVIDTPVLDGGLIMPPTAYFNM